MSRTKCNNCQYILSRCLCSEIEICQSKIPIIILRDKSEVRHALNTVNILKLNLTNLQLIEVDENFNKNLFLKMLTLYKNPALIFPKADSANFDSLNLVQKNSFDAFIFLDGSWNKSKKILFSIEELNHLPSFVINSEETSLYKIRQSNLVNSLSTIEAVTFILNQVTNGNKFDVLLKPFNKMINFQIENIGKEKFNLNYKKKKTVPR